MSNIYAVFQAFHCPNCDTLFNRTFHLERNLTTPRERVKNVYPKNVYQIRETLFEKMNSFGIKYTSQQNFLKNLAVLGFELIYIQEESLKDTKTTTWIGKHVPISVSIFSNLVEEPISLYKSDLQHLVLTFIGTLEGLAPQSKAQMNFVFPDIKTTLKIELGSILEKLTQRHIRREHTRFDMSQDDCDNEHCASTQFSQIQKNQLIDIQESLEFFLQCFACVWFQQCKIRSQLNQILIATHSC